MNFNPKFTIWVIISDKNKMNIKAKSIGWLLNWLILRLNWLRKILKFKKLINVSTLNQWRSNKKRSYLRLRRTGSRLYWRLKSRKVTRRLRTVSTTKIKTLAWNVMNLERQSSSLTVIWTPIDLPCWFRTRRELVEI